MGQRDSKNSATSETTDKPEDYYHRYNYHHHDHYPTVASTVPLFPDSPSRPTRMTTTTTLKPIAPAQPQGSEQLEGLGFPAILFISIGSGVVLVVFLVCLVVTWRHCKRRKLTNWKQESKVGRAIQRASFFPRFSRYRNQPIVLNYPDPDSHLPNYPIRTPYTFSSSTTLASTSSFQLQENKNISDVPSYRATIY